VSKEIEQKYIAGNICGAYELLRGRYQKRGILALKPTQKDLDLICKQFLNLYQNEEPPGNPVLIHVSPLPVNSLDTSCVVYTTHVLYHDIFIKESGIHLLSILKGWFSTNTSKCSMYHAVPLLALPPTLPNAQFMKLQM
jgi:hypothetical protein